MSEDCAKGKASVRTYVVVKKSSCFSWNAAVLKKIKAETADRGFEGNSEDGGRCWISGFDETAAFLDGKPTNLDAGKQNRNDVFCSFHMFSHYELFIAMLNFI